VVRLYAARVRWYVLVRVCCRRPACICCPTLTWKRELPVGGVRLFGKGPRTRSLTSRRTLSHACGNRFAAGSKEPIGILLRVCSYRSHLNGYFPNREFPLAGVPNLGYQASMRMAARCKAWEGSSELRRFGAAVAGGVGRDAPAAGGRAVRGTPALICKARALRAACNNFSRGGRLQGRCSCVRFS